MSLLRLLIVVLSVGAAPFAALAQGAPTPVAEAAVAGRWVKLPIPANYCALDESGGIEKAFSESARLSALKEQRQVLLPFARCDEIKAFREDESTANFGFGSYDAALKEGMPWVLPADVSPADFIAYLGTNAPAKFDPALVAPLFGKKVPEDAQLLRAGVFRTEPDANYVAIFQRIEPQRRRDSATIATGMRATTVISGVPIILTVVRFDAHDTSVYDELLRAEQDAVRNLRTANGMK